MTTRNIVAIVLLLASKLFGIIGVGLGFLHDFRTLASVLLVTAGLSLCASFVIAIMEMRAQNKKITKSNSLERTMIDQFGIDPVVAKQIATLQSS